MSLKKDNYDIRLNSQGYIFAPSPEPSLRRPSRSMIVAPVYQNRFAQGDRSFNDFALWWYFAQTDWSGGEKDDTSFVDDATFYYGTNVDVITDPGAIRLANGLATNKTFTENLICGITATVGVNIRNYVGTDDNASSKPVVYERTSGSTWNDISSATWPTANNIVSQLVGRLGNLWSHNIGTSSTYSMTYYNGSAWVDVSANVLSTVSISYTTSRCAVDVGGTYYIFMDSIPNTAYAIVSCTLAAPTVNGDFTKVLEKTTVSATPIDACNYLGVLYYLLLTGTSAELHKVVGSTDTIVYTFKNSDHTPLLGLGGKLLIVRGEDLIITASSSEIWKFNSSTGDMTRIFKKNTDKANIGNEAAPYLVRGGVLSGDKIYWGNLIYDGTHFYPWIKDSADATNTFYFPIFTDNSDVIWGTDTGNPMIIYSGNSSAYKGTADKNFLVMSNFDTAPAVDKLAYSVTLLFKPLVSGQSISVEYTTGELTSSSTWTSIGSASFTADGGSAIQKKLYFATNTSFKKIWLRVKLASDGTNTPTLRDVIMEYLPLPDYKSEWHMNVKIQKDMMLKDGKSPEIMSPKKLRNMLWQILYNKQVVNLEDIDYISFTLNDGSFTATSTTVTVNEDTDNCPDQGTLRIGAEWIKYTTRGKRSFSGLTRGYRGTVPASASNTAAVDYGIYPVIMTELNEKQIVTEAPLVSEWQVSMVLREI